MSASSSLGWMPLLTWAAAVDPADVPMIRSASVTSNPASNRPAMTPISHALPADPPPPRTNARSPAARERLEASTCWSALGRSPCPGASIAATVNPSPDPSPATARRAPDTSSGAYLCRPPSWPIRSSGAPSVADSGDHSTPLMSPSVKVRSAMLSEVVVEVKCRVEEGVVFMGVAFRELPVGRSRWRLPQSRDLGLQGSTHCGYCVHGSHLLPMDHDRRNASTPATRHGNRHHAGCRVAVERAADRFTLICDEPVYDHPNTCGRMTTGSSTAGPSPTSTDSWPTSAPASTAKPSSRPARLWTISLANPAHP